MDILVFHDTHFCEIWQIFKWIYIHWYCMSWLFAFSFAFEHAPAFCLGWPEHQNVTPDPEVSTTIVPSEHLSTCLGCPFFMTDCKTIRSLQSWNQSFPLDCYPVIPSNWTLHQVYFKGQFSQLSPVIREWNMFPLTITSITKRNLCGLTARNTYGALMPVRSDGIKWVETTHEAA